jgi:activator of HSP90 ATPase
MNTRNLQSIPSQTPTRRQWLTGAAFTFTFGALAVTTRASAEISDGVSHSAESIHQETIFKASPKRIYDALLDARQFQQIELIGQAMKASDLEAKPAQISREPGGPFSLFGAYIIGRHIELVPNQRIVQAWRELSWDPGVYSLVKFELIPEGTGTKLVFDHTGFPAGAGEHLASGWKSHYWEPLDKLLGAS